MQAYLSTKEMFAHLPEKLLKSTAVKNRGRNRIELAAEMFDLCFYHILLDIVENNVTFVLPLKFGDYGELHILSVTGEAFKELWRKGYARKNDFVLTNFTANSLCYSFKMKNKSARRRHVKITGVAKQRLDELTLQQKQYY